MLTFKVESTLSLCMLGCNVFSEFIPGNWVRDTAMIEFFVSVCLRCWHNLRTLLFIKIYSCMLRVLSKKNVYLPLGPWWRPLVFRCVCYLLWTLSATGSVCVSSVHNAPVYSLYNTREREKQEEKKGWMFNACETDWVGQ